MTGSLHTPAHKKNVLKIILHCFVLQVLKKKLLIGTTFSYAASKRSEAMRLLSRLVDVGASDPQVALALLCLCGSYCKLIHLASYPT